MLIVLDDWEIDIARQWAEKRHKNGRDLGLKVDLVAACYKGGYLEADFHGMLGELAGAKAFNVWPDLSGLWQAGSHDFTYGGFRVDVKATAQASGNLLLKPDKAGAGRDIYVLAIVRDTAGTMVELMGWEWARIVTQEKNLTKLGKNQTLCYFVKREDLKPIKLLMDYVSPGDVGIRGDLTEEFFEGSK